jgi:hypothetical protein
MVRPAQMDFWLGYHVVLLTGNKMFIPKAECTHMLLFTANGMATTTFTPSSTSPPSSSVASSSSGNTQSSSSSSSTSLPVPSHCTLTMKTSECLSALFHVIPIRPPVLDLDGFVFFPSSRGTRFVAYAHHHLRHGDRERSRLCGKGCSSLPEGTFQMPCVRC